MVSEYVPDRGDVIAVNFSPQAGHEQANRRPALVLSPGGYNRASGLLLACPITNQQKGYPFEVEINEKIAVSGVILADQIKSLDWNSRAATFICKMPEKIMDDVLAKINVLIF
jgi:transcriptional modulator of MazE/toxin, MazF